MKKKIFDHNRVFLVTFAVLSLFLIVYLIVIATGYDRQSAALRSFGEGWSDQYGNVYLIDDVKVDDTGVSPVVSKTLPDDIANSDCLCFETYNIDVFVSVDGERIYTFESKENITGKGYGTAYHEVGLSSAFAGKTVDVSFCRSNMNVRTKRGHIQKLYIGEAVDYVHMILWSNIVPIIASGLITFFGIVFLLIGMVISDNERLPFDLVSLGLTSLIVGLWLILLTNVFQIITNHIYVVRVLNRFLILLSGVPLVSFFSSLTRKKRRIYTIIEAWISVGVIATIVILRYAAGIDMMVSFQRVLLVFFAGIITLTIVMFAEQESVCRADGVPSGLKPYYIGITAFIACALIDYALYYNRRLFGNAYGTITSIAVFLLVPAVMIRFIRWWTKDRQVTERERFTNRALQYALSSDSPDESIRLMLEYMSEELKCKRAIVFEDMRNGRYAGRYSWFDQSLGKRTADLLYVPYNGFVAQVLGSYKADGNRFIIRDMENYKDINQNVYNLLGSYEVKNLVASPLEVDKTATGLLVLTDMPDEILEEASSVAGLISYFLSQLILRRDDQKRMRMYMYNDSLSQALNRRAYDEFVKDKLDMSSAFGYMSCEIADLEEISEKEGFDAGDELIRRAVGIMGEVFGKDNVYRMAGSRFAAFGFETDEAIFRDDVARFEKNASENGIRVSVGAIYCLNGTMDMRSVINSANQKMRNGGQYA